MPFLRPTTSRRLLRPCLVLLAAGSGCRSDSLGVADVLVVSGVTVTPATSTVVVGGSVQLTAVPSTASGIPVPGRPVSWSATGSGVQVSANGVVTAQAVGGPIRVRATIDGVAGEAEVTVSDRPVASVQVTPTPASVTVGQTLQLAAQPFDADGAPLSGRLISWQSSDPATVAVTTTGVVLGVTAGGPVTITATSEGRSAASLVTAVPAPAVRLAFTAQPAGGVAGQPLAPSPQVTIQNQAGGTVTSATGPVTLSLASNPGSAGLGGTVTVNAVAGIASFPNLRIDRAGSGYRLEATAAGLAPAVSSAFDVAAATPSRLAFTIPAPATAQSGVPLGPAPAVQVLDQDDAPVRQAGIVVSVALQGGGTLGGTATASTDGNGVASFGPLTITGAPGSRTLLFTAGTLQLTSGPIALGAGPLAVLAIATQPPATAASGQAFGQQPVVQLRDAFGNAVNQAGINVTAAIGSGGGTLGGTATVATNAAGTASFSGLSITGLAGSRTLSFQAPGLAPVTSTTIAVGPGTASRLALTTQPSATVVNDAVFAVQPQVQVQDASGNPVAQAGVVVTAAIMSGAGTLGGTITALTNAAGLASFGTLRITGTVGNRSLGFSAPGLASVTSTVLSVIAGAATQLALTTQPSAVVVSGQAFPQQPVAQLRDASGNAVSQAGVNVAASIASGGGTLGGTATVATNAAGTAVYSGLAITGTAGSRTLGFQATGMTAAVSSPVEVTVTAASGTQLTIATQPPASVANDAVFSPQPAIQLRDALGNPVAVAGVVVTAAVATGGGTLGGTVTEPTNASGLATFSNLKLTGTVGVRTLGFSAPSVPAVVSTPVTLTVGPAAQLTVTTQPPASVVNNTVFSPQPAVQVRDAGGNAVSSAGVVVTASIASGAGVLGGTLTATTNASGLATFSNLRIVGVTGARTLGFSATGLAAATSATVTVTPGAAKQLVVTRQPSATAASGQPFPQQPVVQVADTSGNAVSQAGVNLTATIASGGGTLGGTATVATAATGAATFAGLSITGLVGARTLGFSATGLVATTSAGISLTAGAATQLTIATQPSASAVNDVAFAQQPVVRIRDAAGNAVAGVVVTAAIATGGGVLGGIATATSDAGGLATFAGLKITGTTGARTLSFSATGLPTATSSTVTITAGSATQLSITTQPSATVKVNTEFPQQPVIQLRDVSGNAVSLAGVAVTVAVATGPGALAGTTTVTTNSSGVASFSKLSLGAAGSYTLRFTSGVLTAVISNSIVVTP